MVSHHHQGIADVPPMFHISAVAPDGVIEAFEERNGRFLMGVQWHPEITAATDMQQQRLNDAFVAAARRYAQARSVRLRCAMHRLFPGSLRLVSKPVGFSHELHEFHRKSTSDPNSWEPASIREIRGKESVLANEMR